MKIYIVGISCVGKTTIGSLLADNLNYPFYDLDEEVERYYQKPIEQIQNECYSISEYRQKASVVLDNLFTTEENSVIAGTTAGLKDSYFKIYQKHKKRKDLISIHIIDDPENVLNRLTFYDADSKLYEKVLDDKMRKMYLKEIVADWKYFQKSLSLADFQISIKNVPLNQIPGLIVQNLNETHPNWVSK
jgi:shikimate kinase